MASGRALVRHGATSSVAGIPRALPGEVPVLRFATRITTRWSAVAARVASAALAVLAACAGGERARGTTDGGTPAIAAGVTTIVDDLGDTLRLPAARGERRLVSLNPTTTEIVFALGLGDRLVGRSRWDAWPAEAARVPSVGDGIRPNVEAIFAARPTLVVLYASADNRPAARALRAAGIATLSVRVDSIAEFRRVTRMLGDVLGVPERGRAIVDSVDATLARVRRATRDAARPTVLWRAWDAPLMVIGGGSYFTELVDIAGGRNAFADDPRPSPQVSFEEVLRRNPDHVLAGDSAAAAATRGDARWRTLPAVRDGRVLVVDGELLARPSVRLGEAAVHLASRLHPSLAASLQLPAVAR